MLDNLSTFDLIVATIWLASLVIALAYYFYTILFVAHPTPLPAIPANKRAAAATAANAALRTASPVMFQEILARLDVLAQRIAAEDGWPAGCAFYSAATGLDVGREDAAA